MLRETRHKVVFGHLTRLRQGAGNLHGLTQALHQGIEPPLRIAPGIVARGIGMHDHHQLAGQVVEHHDFIGHHEQNIRRLQGVLVHALFQPWLDITHRVVTEVTHQTTAKAWQTFQVRRTKPLLEILDPLQRVVTVGFFDQFTVGAQLDALPVHAQYRATRQADNGVAPPLLAALHGLEQIGVRPAGELQVSA